MPGLMPCTDRGGQVDGEQVNPEIKMVTSEKCCIEINELTKQGEGQETGARRLGG